MATVFGIDLGTTFSCIARCDDNQAITSLSPRNAVYGGDNLPSVVYYEEGTGMPIVGATAKNALGSRRTAGRVMAYMKRYMGLKCYPETVLVNEQEMNNISPIEGSACVLHHLLSCAREQEKASGGPDVVKAVITIPAGFTNRQRECTKIAAELAGIKLLGLVHEPTAAAICHGIQSGETILVFDLGGGTLDVSIVTNNRGSYKVLSTAGDVDVLGHSLGGKDWDDKLMKHVLEKYDYQTGNITGLEESTEIWKLRNRIEECKINLSSISSSTFEFPNGQEGTVELNEFEAVTESLVGDCIKVVRSAIDKADKESTTGPIRINRCVLAGGSSSMPMIRKNISRYLAPRIANGRLEKDWLNSTDPVRAIAKGAARYAFLLEHKLAKGDGILVGVEEKSSHSYGTSFLRIENGEVVGKFIKNLIFNTDNLIVPKEENRTFPFSVSENGQKGVPVDLYENNRVEKDFPFDASLDPIYNKMYTFNPDVKVTKNTKVFFKVSRDENGIINILVESDGHKSEDYPISTIDPPLSEDQKLHIFQSINLMDAQHNECKW